MFETFISQFLVVVNVLTHIHGNNQHYFLFNPRFKGEEINLIYFSDFELENNFLGSVFNGKLYTVDDRTGIIYQGYWKSVIKTKRNILSVSLPICLISRSNFKYLKVILFVLFPIHLRYSIIRSSLGSLSRTDPEIRKLRNNFSHQ